MLFAAAACDLVVYSERSDFSLAVEGVASPEAQPLGGWPAPYLVLAGTRMCVEGECLACTKGENEAACDFEELEVSGPLQPVGDGCYVAADPGEVTWTWPGCGDPELPPDALHMRVVDPDDVEPAAVHELDEYVRTEVAGDTAELAALGAPWLGAVEWPLRLVAESTVSLPVEVRERASGHPVAIEASQAEVVWETVSGRPAIVYPGLAIAPVVFAGGEYRASFRVGDRTWPLGQVLGVSSEAAASLEIAASVAFEDDADAPLLGRSATPFIVHAIARDAEGHPLLGLPVVWTLDRGAIGAWTDLLGPTRSEYLVLEDACVHPEDRGGPREIVLRATHGELSTAITLRWTGEDAASETDWRPPATCLAPTSEGCGCRTDAPGGGALLGLGLLALLRRRRVRKSMSLGACLIGLPLAGCSEPDPPALRAAESLELGILRTPSAGDGGASVAVGGRMVWLFHADDSALNVEYSAARRPWPAQAAVSDDLDARDGLYPFAPVLDAEAEPLELLALDADEVAYNAANRGGTCGEDSECAVLGLKPGPVVHDPARGRLLLFYTKFKFAVTSGAAHPIGSSLAVWRDDLAGLPARPRVAEGADEPTLLFAAPELRVVAAALVEDGQLYAFLCESEDDRCILARAPLEEALGRDGWHFYADDDVWAASPAAAQPLFDGAPTMSVHYNAYAEVYIAAYARPGAARVVVRTAPRLAGPWSGSGEIHQVWQPIEATTIRGARFHPELAQGGGAVDYLTYYHAEAGTRQLVEIRWE